MTRADRIALVISLVTILVTFYVTLRYFEGIPHLEDEIAYVWQARAITEGKLTVPSPPQSESFLVPFVVDHNGQRFGKYPLGWPVVLAIGIRLGIRSLVNPLLSGLGVWLTYRLGKKVFGETVGIIAAVLTLTSPFFLINSGTLLSHSFGLVLSTAFALAWIDGFGDKNGFQRTLPTVVAGFSLGVLVLTRPLTALAVAFPFAIHGLYMLVRSDWQTRRHVLAVGGLALSIGALTFLWQYSVTGNALLNPYTLWWPYDKVGFGEGFGLTEGGHNLRLARVNTRFSLRVGYSDLFGWLRYSWIFLPFGLLAALLRRNWRGILIASVLPSLVIFYMAYWVGAWIFGPRYYFEGLFSLTIISGVGIAWLAGWPISRNEIWPRYEGWKRFRPLLVLALVAVMVIGNLVYYIPPRLENLRGLYGMERADLTPFFTEKVKELTPAVIVVHPKSWMEYGVLLDLQSPTLNSPYIFIFSRSQEEDEALRAEFPERDFYHYYPHQDPYVLLKSPRP
jgi:4-amino-4-deoxy-L-arabinose transferase-like glycosyltransferase